MAAMSGSCNSVATKAKPVLHVEVRLKTNPETFIRNDLIREDVTDWLCGQFRYLKVGHDIRSFEGFDQGDAIASINVTDCSGPSGEMSMFNLDEVTLDVQAYQLDDPGADVRPSAHRPSCPSSQDEDEEEPVDTQLRTKTLPSASIDGIWESLVFDKPMPARLLQFITRMASITRSASLSPHLIAWNHLILLHGPPGGGKTSLCRALAQKLAIRLGKDYATGKLVEVNASALLSKWFGESSKLISKVFDSIHALAAEETTLVVVLIDEVETLTSSRERAATSNECGDALRATNELLTCLDRIKSKENILILATSNLPQAIDPAFLDRVDVKQFVPLPSSRAAYEILRSSLNELIRGGLVSTPVRGSSPSLSTSPSRSNDPSEPSSAPDDWDMLDPASTASGPAGLLPAYENVEVHLFNRVESAGYRVSKVAERCARAGISGRALRRLPVKSLAMYTFGEECELNECISALELAVDETLEGSTDGAKQGGMSEV